MYRIIAFVSLLAALTSGWGCVGPQLGADGKGVTATNSTHNLARQDAESWETLISGPFPTNAVIDKDGANVQTGGPNTVLGLNLPNDVRLFTSNPADTAIESLTYTSPDGSIIEIVGFTSIKSTVIAAYDAQVIQWAESQNIITTEQGVVASKLVEGGMNALEAIAVVLGGV